MRRTFSGDIASDCDASTSRTCDVPMPNAIAPNAPCVDVWLSPQHDRHARLRQPQLRTDDVHDALRSARQVEQRDAVRRGSSARAPPSSLSAIASANGRACAPVGTMWSTVANVRSGAAHRASRARAARRTPAGSSLRGRGAGRCRAASARSAACGRRGGPRLSETACGMLTRSYQQLRLIRYRVAYGQAGGQVGACRTAIGSKYSSSRSRRLRATTGRDDISVARHVRFCPPRPWTFSPHLTLPSATRCSTPTARC